MIQARKLVHVVLKVRDAQKSKEFYIRALGLKVANDAQLKKLLAILNDKEFEVPANELAGSLLSRDDVSPAYRLLLAERADGARPAGPEGAGWVAMAVN